MNTFINTNTDISKEIFISPKQVSLEEYYEELEDVFGEYVEPTDQPDSDEEF